MCERVRVSEGVSVRWNEASVLPGLWLKSAGFGAIAHSNTVPEREQHWEKKQIVKLYMI